MELEARLESLAEKVKQHAEILGTEEAAKTALVMPFLQALGYDVFNPDEVVPEFTCDVGGRRHEKVDYAIRVNGHVSMLIECKPSSQALSIRHASQLFRYFATTDAKFAILTNGAEFKFYSDLDALNKMDERPFFEFDLRDLRKADARALAKFQKGDFDPEATREAAASLQMERAVEKAIESELEKPSQDFVRIIGKQVTDRVLTAGLKSALARHIPNAFNSLIRERLNQRLTSAMSDGGDEEPASTSEVDTTEDEMEGFRIVSAIGAELVDTSRIVMRDSQSYCAILLDDNNRKPIARLRFNSPTTRHLSTFDADKNETLNPVAETRDIYRYKEAILARIQSMIDDES